MRKKIVISSLSAAVVLMGCAAPIPVAENFPIAYQKVARTAKHWDVVAADVVGQTIDTIAKTPVLQNRPVFVVQNLDGASFDAGFRDFMISHLVDKAMVVNVCSDAGASPTNAVQSDIRQVQVRYEARPIKHKAKMPYYRTGEVTALAAGVSVLYGAFDADIVRDLTIAAGVGTVGVLDLWEGARSKPTQTELLVTTTIYENNRYLMHRNDIYYVPDADIGLFLNSVGQRNDCGGINAPISRKSHQDHKHALLVEEFSKAAFRRDMCRVNAQWC